MASDVFVYLFPGVSTDSFIIGFQEQAQKLVQELQRTQVPVAILTSGFEHELKIIGTKQHPDLEERIKTLLSEINVHWMPLPKDYEWNEDHDSTSHELAIALQAQIDIVTLFPGHYSSFDNSIKVQSATSFLKWLEQVPHPANAPEEVPAAPEDATAAGESVGNLSKKSESLMPWVGLAISGLSGQLLRLHLEKPEHTEALVTLLAYHLLSSQVQQWNAAKPLTLAETFGVLQRWPLARTITIDGAGEVSSKLRQDWFAVLPSELAAGSSVGSPDDPNPLGAIANSLERSLEAEPPVPEASDETDGLSDPPVIQPARRRFPESLFDDAPDVGAPDVDDAAGSGTKDIGKTGDRPTPSPSDV
ncbi:MAG: hypothetical protein D6742_05675, partial [Cyanobacteria bacterium J069]